MYRVETRHRATGEIVKRSEPFGQKYCQWLAARMTRSQSTTSPLIHVVTPHPEGTT